MTKHSNSGTRDVNTLLHPYTNLAALDEASHLTPLILERGEGVYVKDELGKPYIEGMAGLWCTSLGYGNEEMIDAASAQMRDLSFSHLFGAKSHHGAIELGEKLKQLSPAPASKIFFTSSGSEANDTQIKLAWYYNNARGLEKKKKIISRQKAYHGVTLASASLTGLPANHADFDLPLAGIIHTDCPHHYRFAQEGESEEEFAARLAQNLEELIEREDPDTIAAFIAEPIMGAGGVILPPKTYFEKIQTVLKNHDIHFIVDEVICGFGRTGQYFGSNSFNISPDTISMAKGLTSAYAPLGAITVSEPFYQAFLDQSRKIGTFGHGFTYSGHPLSVALALKALEIYERDNIVGHVQDVSPYFMERLTRLQDHPLIGESRGMGLIGGLEIISNKQTKRPYEPNLMVGAKCVAYAQEMGLIVRNLGDTIALCPPLIISSQELAELFDILEKALDKTASWVKTAT